MNTDEVQEEEPKLKQDTGVGSEIKHKKSRKKFVKDNLNTLPLEGVAALSVDESSTSRKRPDLIMVGNDEYAVVNKKNKKVDNLYGKHIDVGNAQTATGGASASAFAGNTSEEITEDHTYGNVIY